MTSVPKQLQNPKFRFVLLGGWNTWKHNISKAVIIVELKDYLEHKKNKDWKPLGKSPFEKEWQTKNNYKFDDVKLINNQHNFGVIGGYGGLIILDIDDKELAEKLLKQLNTFAVRTGSGGVHFYFISDYKKNHVLINKQGELRANKYQVVSAPCKHPSGNYYEIIKDIPIAEISSKDLLELIKPYLREEAPITKATKSKGKDTSRSGLEYRRILALLREGKNREEIYKIMEAYSKWASSPEQYKKITFESAEAFYLQERLKSEKKEESRENNDLKTFIFDKNEIIQNRVFSSHLLNDSIFGFGLLLPREEDTFDKKGNITGKTQIWRPVSITSDRRGLTYGSWFQKDYKIKFEEIPYFMKLRWELEDIDTYVHKNPEKVSGKDLLDAIKKQYEYYLYFREPLLYYIHALWDIGTYSHQVFSAYPIFENRGLSGTAKTKTMVVSSYITLNATDIMINPSEATLFRETECIRPTKYIDEAERLFKWTKEGMEPDNRVELINASYTRNGAVLRQEKQGNKYVTKRYHCYSPTMISSITGLFGATENRAITQIHTKSPDNDKRGERDPEDDINDVKWKEIRNKCYLFTLQNWKRIYDEYLTFQIGVNKEGKEYGIKKRDLQIWKPILVLAKIIDAKLYEDILLFAEKTSNLRRADLLSEGTTDYKVLSCLKEILTRKYHISNKDDKIYVEEIREVINGGATSGLGVKDKGYNKTISSHLDKLGFKDYRTFDTNKGSYFEITIPIFNSITDLQCPQLSIKDLEKQETLT